MKNKLFFSLFILLFLLISQPKIHAYDLIMTCDNSRCTSNGSSLFNEGEMAPGFSTNKTIQIINANNQDDCDLHIALTRSGIIPNPDISKKIFSTIWAGSETYKADSLFNFFNNDVYIGKINKNSAKDYVWDLHFEESSGNEYQGAGLNFQFDLKFVCGYPASIPPTSTTSPTRFNRVDSESSYETAGMVLAESTFADNNIYETDPEFEIITKGNVLGEECIKAPVLWWVILLIQGILSAFTVVLKLVVQKFKLIWLLLILFGVGSQILHWIWGCGCDNNSNLCEYYLLFNLGQVLVFGLGYNRLIRKKSVN